MGYVLTNNCTISLYYNQKINRSFNCQPLRYQYAKWRKQHGNHADYHNESGIRHFFHQALHIFDIAAADTLFDGANTEEEQTF